MHGPWDAAKGGFLAAWRSGSCAPQGHLTGPEREGSPLFSAAFLQYLAQGRGAPRVDLVVVVDDGSTDGTQDHARAAGAVTVRHSVGRGKASALETGVSVVGMRDYEDGPARLLLFIDADLGDSAAACAELVSPVVDGVADMAIAVPPKQAGAGGRGRVVRLARSAIAVATGWAPVAPLAGQRCPTRRAYEARLVKTSTGPRN